MADSGTGNSTTASDVITYIGVPLAVLGVLPILYNTVATLAQRRDLRAHEAIQSPNLLVTVIRDAGSAAESGPAVDLQECLGIWRQVRLG
ncbi:hypothetical protein LZ30DRAFT_780016 [Colletotrichum cereale]|nr:hypothetical protein LZ30DRAFT_780016 [Colletotrichum cereale]